MNNYKFLSLFLLVFTVVYDVTYSTILEFSFVISDWGVSIGIIETILVVIAIICGVKGVVEDSDVNPHPSLLKSDRQEEENLLK